MKLFYVLLSLLALLYCFPNVIVRHLIYPGRHMQKYESSISSRFAPYVVEIPVEGGLVQRGWLLNRGAKAPLVAVYGGNNMNVGSLLDLAERDRSRSYLLINYRGYGQSEGTPSQDAIVADACHHLDWARERLGAPASVHLVGFSIGTGVAMQVAAQLSSRKMIDSLVLICPFDSLRETARQHVGGLVSSLIRSDEYDSAAVAPLISCPVTIIAGRQDTIVFPSQTTRLAASFTRVEPQMYWLQAGHNDIFSSAQAKRYIIQGLRKSSR